MEKMQGEGGVFDRKRRVGPRHAVTQELLLSDTRSEHGRSSEGSVCGVKATGTGSLSHILEYTAHQHKSHSHSWVKCSL